MRARSFTVVLVSGLALAGLGAACGPTVVDDVFTQGGNNDGGGGAASATSGMSSSQGGSAVVGSGGSGAQSTASSAESSSAMSSSSTGGNPAIQVYCQGEPCAQGEVCCYNTQNADLDTCGPPGSCDPAAGFITFACNDLEDCPGQQCCADVQNNQYIGIACYDACTGTQRIMCEGHPELCPADLQCDTSQTLGEGYSRCK